MTRSWQGGQGGTEAKPTSMSATACTRSAAPPPHLPRLLEAAHEGGVVHHIQLEACGVNGIIRRRPGKRGVRRDQVGVVCRAHTTQACKARQLRSLPAPLLHHIRPPVCGSQRCLPIRPPPPLLPLRTRLALRALKPRERLLPLPARLAGAEQRREGEGVPAHPRSFHVLHYRQHARPMVAQACAMASGCKLSGGEAGTAGERAFWVASSRLTRSCPPVLIASPPPGASKLPLSTPCSCTPHPPQPACSAEHNVVADRIRRHPLYTHVIVQGKGGAGATWPPRQHVDKLGAQHWIVCGTGKPSVKGHARVRTAEKGSSIKGIWGGMQRRGTAHCPAAACDAVKNGHGKQLRQGELQQDAATCPALHRASPRPKSPVPYCGRPFITPNASSATSAAPQRSRYVSRRRSSAGASASPASAARRPGSLPDAASSCWVSRTRRGSAPGWERAVPGAAVGCGLRRAVRELLLLLGGSGRV